MYLIFPIIMYATRRAGWWILILLAVASAIGVKTLIAIGDMNVPVWSALRALPTFTLGILLSQLPPYQRVCFGEPIGALAFSGAIASMIFHAGTCVVISLFCLSIAFTAMRNNAIPFFNSTLLRRFGDCSYAIYLLHAIVFTVFYKSLWPHFFLSPPPLLVGFAILFAMVPVAYLTFLLFEDPARELISNGARGVMPISKSASG